MDVVVLARHAVARPGKIAVLDDEDAVSPASYVELDRLSARANGRVDANVYVAAGRCDTSTMNDVNRSLKRWEDRTVRHCHAHPTVPTWR
ncbi:MAG: hypothetical protein ACTHMY_02185 [Solirubrobacteraceae bacterium]